MIRLLSNTKVFLTLGVTDMRKAMNGLSIIASEQMKKDIFLGKNRVIMVYTSYDSGGF